MAKHSKTSHVPSDVIFDILLRLPTKDLLQIMRVCEKFIKAHLELMETNAPRILVVVQFGFYDCRVSSVSISLDGDVLGNPVRLHQPLGKLGNYTTILGCCYGLVCINIYNESSKGNHLVIWNPSIQRFKRIPSKTKDWPPYMDGSPKYGFGYDSTNDDYKLVRVQGLEVTIYSLKSNSWKEIPSLPGIKDFQNSPPYLNHVTFFNGALHWLGNDERVGILDLATQKYDDFPTPEVAHHSNKYDSLGVLGGYLCVCFKDLARLPHRNQFWIMKEYGVTESWTPLCTIQYPGLVGYCKPLVFSKNSKMVLVEENSCRLWWYDLENEE